MEKEFVTWEQALALKELGFDESCLGFYDDISKDFYQIHSHASSNNDVKNITTAPLKQQAIRFLLNTCDDMHCDQLSIEYFGDESGELKNYGGSFTSLTQAIDRLIMLAKMIGCHNMRTSDFRIGNIVSVDNLTECKVIEIKEKHLRVEYTREDTQTIHRPLIEIGRIFPIPLSEEKMERFQFEPCGYDLLFWQHPKLHNVEFAGINWADRDIPEYQFLNIRVDHEIFKICQVHQLQNLFHSLTSEDLERN